MSDLAWPTESAFPGPPALPDLAYHLTCLPGLHCLACLPWPAYLPAYLPAWCVWPGLACLPGLSYHLACLPACIVCLAWPALPPYLPACLPACLPGLGCPTLPYPSHYCLPVFCRSVPPLSALLYPLSLYMQTDSLLLKRLIQH